MKVTETSQQVMGYDTMRPNKPDCVTETVVFCSKLRTRG